MAAQEYLWQGKYRILSEVDPATYYPNGINSDLPSGSGISASCFRLYFPLSPGNYFFDDNDLPPVVAPRRYFEQEDITEDAAWSLYLIQSQLDECSLASFGGEPGFLVITGDFSPDMILNLDTGKMTGRTGEMDQYVSGLNIPPDYEIDEQNYATVGSASFFRNGVGFEIPIQFTARVFNKSNPDSFIDTSFQYGLSNNWSSDRDYLILNIKNQFFLNGATATNLEYLETQKTRGFFPGPP
jgi:hypothetical protein